jgi:myo-inositol-1(or 4)-monophosphatase
VRQDGCVTPPQPSAALLDELVEVCERVAREGGQLVHDGRPARVEVASTKSSPQDVVTAMDLACERLVHERLAAARPTDAILGEEGGLQPGTSGITWLVDPIDGTVNYLYGLPDYAVMVAAVATGDDDPDPATWTVLAGCVHAPAGGRTYTAARGRGAFLDGRRLSVADPPPLDLCLVGTGFGYRREARVSQGRVIAEILPRVRDIRRRGSAGLDLCAVASGRLDLYFERGLQPWDLAAGSLVAAEAGARVCGLRGRAAGEVMTVAGHPDRLGELVEILQDLEADEPL